MGCESKKKGDATEAVVLAEFVKAGVPVLLPFGDNQPYDMVIEWSGEFHRIQCKTGRIRNGVVLFNTESNGLSGSRSYTEAADYFAVYCPENGRVYLVPVKDSPKSACALRLEKPKNNQASGIKLAEDYEFCMSRID